MSDLTIADCEAIRTVLAASPDDYWNRIVKEVEDAVRDKRLAALLSQEAAHLLFWAKLARTAAIERYKTPEREASLATPPPQNAGINPV